MTKRGSAPLVLPIASQLGERVIPVAESLRLLVLPRLELVQVQDREHDVRDASREPASEPLEAAPARDCDRIPVFDLAEPAHDRPAARTAVLLDLDAIAEDV